MNLTELTQQTVQLLAEKNQSLSLAESCTGGQVAVEFTKIPGVSRVFIGGVVCYHGHVKRDLLSVNEDVLKQYGEVSVEVAQQMAKGAVKNMNSAWGVSITGIAGPGGGSESKPVGTVCFGIIGPNIEKTIRHNFNPEATREEIQQASVQYAIQLLNENLKNN